MKPKNRIMCPDCGRQKMLFETEAKAKTFIKFNGSKLIDDPSRLRVYYCPACCGYHISSKEYTPRYEGRTDRMIKLYQQNYKIKEIDYSAIETLFNILKDKDFKTRREVNNYLKGRSDFSDSTKGRVREKYYNYKNIWDTL